MPVCFLDYKEDVHVEDTSTLNIDCDYIQIASNGTAYQFVKPEIVIGVDFYDTQIEKSDQQPIKKPIF